CQSHSGGLGGGGRFPRSNRWHTRPGRPLPGVGEGGERFMSRNLAPAARDYFEQALREHYLARYRAYLRDEEHDQGFLEDHMLRWEKWRENQLGLPEEVYAAHLFYVQHFTDADIGSDRVFKVTVGGKDVYAVRTTTDGDDSYLELYDAGGALLGAARGN